MAYEPGDWVGIVTPSEDGKASLSQAQINSVRAVGEVQEITVGDLTLSVHGEGEGFKGDVAVIPMHNQLWADLKNAESLTVELTENDIDPNRMYAMAAHYEQEQEHDIDQERGR